MSEDLNALIDTAAEHESAAINRKAAQIMERAHALRDELNEWEAQADLRNELAEIQARKAEIQARLRKGAPDKDEAKRIRAWAEANGLSVASRGRLPRELVEKYQAAA